MMHITTILLIILLMIGCVTVKPQDRAVLADPIMQFEGDPRAADLEVVPFDWLKVRGGWEADVVTGASIATKAGLPYQSTHPGADVVTAASVHDLRNQARGGFTLKKEAVELVGNYAFSTEND